MHNWPGAPEGEFWWRDGPVMAAVANLDVTITGTGAHGALPHTGNDPIVIAAQIVTALQSIVARNVEPVEAGVITIGHINGGSTWNIIPETVKLMGTARWFKPEVGDLLEKKFTEICHGIAAAFGAKAEVVFDRAYPATVNETESTSIAREAAKAVVGEAKVKHMDKPTMGGEDFSFMLNACPGNYIMLGGGRPEGSAQVHNPAYDFNDQILPAGASYWATLVEKLLPR
jgi:hippurate hydrolase